MNNILILNLGTSKDLLMSSHLISSYKEEYPHAQVSLLTYTDNEEMAKTLNGVSKIYSINSDFIQNIIDNPLYSDAFAINEFAASIEEVTTLHWDKVINYSNDNASAYLMSIFQTNEVIGSYIDNGGTVKTTDKWTTYQNYVMSKMSRFPISIPAVRNHMALTPLYSDVEKIKIDPEYLFVANQNFTRIRQMNGANAKYVVGINLEVGYNGQTIEESSIKDIIETLEDSEDYKVVLLTSGKSFQKEIVNRLNHAFNDNLVSINVDSVALSSVISNIDMLVSTANDQLVIADALDIKIIEIKEHSDSFKTPLITNEGNFIIYNNKGNSMASDIVLALNESFETHMPITSLNSENPTYLSIKDDYGVYLTQIRGELNIQDEITYHIQRAVHFEMLGYPRNTELLSHMKANTDSSEIKKFSSEIKEQLTDTVKVLLSTLRSLKGSKGSQVNLNSFIQYLDKLIKFGAYEGIVGTIVRYFEGHIENIASSDVDDNIKAIETELFELKANLQIVTNILNELTDDSKIEADAKLSAQL